MSQEAINYPYHSHTRIVRDTHALHQGIFSLNVWLTSRAGKWSPDLGPHCNEVRGKRLFLWGDRVLSEHTSCIVSRKDGGAKGAFRLKEDSVSMSVASSRCDSLSRVTLRNRVWERETGRLSFFAKLEFPVHSIQRDNKTQMKVKWPWLALS